MKRRIQVAPGRFRLVDEPGKVTLPCIHAGASAGPAGSHLCDHPDEPLGRAIVCTCDGCGPGKCPGYAALPGFAPAEGDVPVGVAIGSYRWPALVELQLRLIRHTCGSVPVMVSSDHPESVPAIDAICDRYPDVLHWPNVERIGHTGGDCAVWFKAVMWGASRNLAVVAKLSQRFLVTRARWLADGAADLLPTGLPLAARACRGRINLPLRTEAALLDVRQWNRPEVLKAIRPARYWHAPGTYGKTAEQLLDSLIRERLGGAFHPWELFGEDRGERYPGVIWHDANDLGDYRALATAFGITLPTDFHAEGWQGEAVRGGYSFG